jgi:hypothetical protein
MTLTLLDFEPTIHSMCHPMTFYLLNFEQAIPSILSLPFPHAFE